MNRCLYIFLVFFIFPQVHAQSCTDITKEIRNINSEAFTKYPLLTDVKQDILLIMYGRERGSCPEDIQGFSLATKKFIADFDHAYILANSDLLEDHLEAVALTKTLKIQAESLTSYTGAFGVEGDDLISSAIQAVDDFLLLQADTYAREAGDTKVTSRKIQFYKVASLAYESAGNTLESSNTGIKGRALEGEYIKDMESANALTLRANEEYSKALLLEGGSIFSKVSSYVLSRSAIIHFEEARVYYNYHHETEKITSIENSVEKALVTKQALLEDIAIYFGVISILLVALSLFMLHRINLWNRDSYDYFLGNELVQVGRRED